MFAVASPSLKSSFHNTAQKLTVNLFQLRKRHDIKVVNHFEPFTAETQKSVVDNLLKQGAAQIRETKLENVYYDKVGDNVDNSENFVLIKGDKILYKSNSTQWFLKAPFVEEITNKTHTQKADADRILSYSVFVGEKEIRRQLNLQQDVTKIENIKTLDESLKAQGIVPFANINIKTDVYQLQDLIFTIHSTDFGYVFGDVEFTVPNADKKKLIQVSVEKLEIIGKLTGLRLSRQVTDPLKRYIAKNKPDLFKALLKSNVVQE